MAASAPVRAAHNQPLVDDRVKARVRTPCQEAVELREEAASRSRVGGGAAERGPPSRAKHDRTHLAQQLHVYILRLGRLAVLVHLGAPAVRQVNALEKGEEGRERGGRRGREREEDGGRGKS